MSELFFDGSELSTKIFDASELGYFRTTLYGGTRRTIKCFNKYFFVFDTSFYDSPAVYYSSDLETFTNSNFPIDNSYKFGSMGVDLDNNLYISTYVSSSTKDLRKAYLHIYDNDSWSTEELPQLSNQDLLSRLYLSQGTNGTYHAVCLNSTSKEICYNYKTVGGSWNTWENIGSLYNAIEVSAYLDSNNIVHVITYGRVTSGDTTKWIYNNGTSGNWETWEALSIDDGNEIYIYETDDGELNILASQVPSTSPYAGVSNTTGGRGNWVTTNIIEFLEAGVYATYLEYYIHNDIVYATVGINLNYGIGDHVKYFFYYSEGVWSEPVELTSALNGMYSSIYVDDTNLILIYDNASENEIYMIRKTNSITPLPLLLEPTVKDEFKLPRFKPVEITNEKPETIADAFVELNRNLDWVFKSYNEVIKKLNEK